MLVSFFEYCCGFRYKKPNFINSECPICLENTNLVTLARCKHAFCVECISEWLSSNNYEKVKCPICRKLIKFKKKSYPNYYTIDVI